MFAPGEYHLSQRAQCFVFDDLQVKLLKDLAMVISDNLSSSCINEAFAHAYVVIQVPDMACGYIDLYR